MGQVKDIWTNETYANWLMDNGVPDKRVALCLVRWDGQARVHRPVKVISISEDFSSSKLVVPNDGKQYQILGFIKLGNGSYAIHGSNDVIKGKK